MKILLIEDHKLLSEGLKNSLIKYKDIEKVDTIDGPTNIEHIVSLISINLYDLILVDINIKKLKNYNQDGFKIIGGKSGTTDKAGLCWATLANKNNKEYIIVVMGVKFTDYNNTGDGQIEDTLKVLREINSYKVDFSFRGILHISKFIFRNFTSYF